MAAPTRISTNSAVGTQGDPVAHHPGVEQSRVVTKPVPRAQIEDPRAFQLTQVKRRFRLKEIEKVDGTSLVLTLVPSDPDFPFEIAALNCILSVPKGYPASRPHLAVTNKEMGRGFQINVETGFDAIVEALPNGTLLQYLNSLDKQLEQFLAAPKADTIKLIVHKNRAPDVTEHLTLHKASPEPARMSQPQAPRTKAQWVSIVVLPYYCSWPLQRAMFLLQSYE